MKIFTKFNEKCTNFQTKGVTGLLDVAKYFDKPEPRYLCDKCGKKFGFFYFTVSACSVKMGESYIIRCRKCGHVNKRVRGDMKGIE
jgi:DNA-directed RNA polymerase subunit RPC12/RpoP